MKYKSTFTVIYSSKTGKIIQEIWEPLKRLFWPLPWIKFRGKPKFSRYEDLQSWFNEHYPGKNIEYCYYGKNQSEN